MKMNEQNMADTFNVLFKKLKKKLFYAPFNQYIHNIYALFPNIKELLVHKLLFSQENYFESG